MASDDDSLQFHLEAREHAGWTDSDPKTTQAETLELFADYVSFRTFAILTTFGAEDRIRLANMAGLRERAWHKLRYAEIVKAPASICDPYRTEYTHLCKAYDAYLARAAS